MGNGFADLVQQMLKEARADAVSQQAGLGVGEEKGQEVEAPASSHGVGSPDAEAHDSCDDAESLSDNGRTPLADRRLSEATVLTVASDTTVGRAVQYAAGAVSFGGGINHRRRSSIAILRERVAAIQQKDPEIPEEHLQDHAARLDHQHALRKAVGLGRYRAFFKWKARQPAYHAKVLLAREFFKLHDSDRYGSIMGCMRKRLKGPRATYNFGALPWAFRHWWRMASEQRQWREQSAQADEFRMYWGRLRVRTHGVVLQQYNRSRFLVV